MEAGCDRAPSAITCAIRPWRRSAPHLLPEKSWPANAMTPPIALAHGRRGNSRALLMVVGVAADAFQSSDGSLSLSSCSASASGPRPPCSSSRPSSALWPIRFVSRLRAVGLRAIAALQHGTIQPSTMGTDGWLSIEPRSCCSAPSAEGHRKVAANAPAPHSRPSWSQWPAKRKRFVAPAQERWAGVHGCCPGRRPPFRNGAGYG